MINNRTRLLEMMDEGLLDPKATVEWLVAWLSDDDVGEFLDAHELSERFKDDDDE